MPRGYHHLTQDERCQIWGLKKSGLSQRDIGRELDAITRQFERCSATAAAVATGTNRLINRTPPQGVIGAEEDDTRPWRSRRSWQLGAPSKFRVGCFWKAKSWWGGCGSTNTSARTARLVAAYTSCCGGGESRTGAAAATPGGDAFPVVSISVSGLRSSNRSRGSVTGRRTRLQVKAAQWLRWWTALR